MKRMITVSLVAISALGLVGCGDAEPEDRGNAAVGLCRDHGGVIAFDDEVVICRDQTAHRIE